MENIRKIWSSNQTYRIILIIAIIYAFLRLGLHVTYISGELLSDDQIELATPIDLGTYINMVERLQKRENLYPDPTRPLERYIFYQYSPTYAGVFSYLFSRFSPKTLAFIHTLLHLIAYGALYFYWQRIFIRLKLKDATKMLAWTLPIWLVFYSFWGDLSVLNIRVFMALLITSLIDAMLRKRLAWALLSVTLILLTKPQWSVVIALPFILRQHRFFVKLVVLTVITYVCITGLTILILNPTYAWQQYHDYYLLLLNMRANFPWRGPDSSFLGINHSITQIIVYLLGVTPRTLQFTTSLKLLILMPLAWVGLRNIFYPVKRSTIEVTIFSLNFVFALYLGGYIWLDFVWADSVLLGIIIFTYLLATTVPFQSKFVKIWFVLLFILYALTDFIQVMGFVILGEDAIVLNRDITVVVSDPSLYFPLAMILIITFYGLLIANLWQATHLNPIINYNTNNQL